ncbi:hypothetical protein [Nocardia sp. MH4]|uniref:DUF6973 domain-containing protein n=1 Tax=Nocardia sp. MH4 TaxID=1768677 RepID=UPI001C4FD09E|nr:hypothetical protein [Nocardia sp. MH4]
MLGWDLSHIDQAAVQLGRCATIMYTEAASLRNKIGWSIDYFKSEAGTAARDRGETLRVEIYAVAALLNQIAQEISTRSSSIKSNIATIKAAMNGVNSSRWSLYVEDDGTVDSRKSNAEILVKYGPMGLSNKSSEESDYEAQIKGALDNILRDDLIGGEEIARALEALPDSIKSRVGPSPHATDPKLQQILLDYQVPVSSAPPQLWPTGATLDLIRTADPSYQPVVMSQEEVAAMELLLLDKGPFAIYRFTEIKNDASTLSGQLYPGTFDDGQGDAFRHSYWNARMTQEFGPTWTAAYASAHEMSGGNVPQREAMDLYNNERGRDVAMANPGASPEELQTIIQSEISKGNLLVLETRGTEGGQHGNALAYSNIPADRTSKAPGVGVPLPGGR